MALREVKPLDKKQWKLVTAKLESGPTKKSVNALQKALSLAAQIKEA